MGRHRHLLQRLPHRTVRVVNKVGARLLDKMHEMFGSYMQNRKRGTDAPVSLDIDNNFDVSIDYYYGG